ncbi:hypothetical protein OG206_29740 [Streptomyces sp. NBC_01341]|uniref:hypothetical protein n=1 Tax=Streptomyces sp. NBC_01341 TaxID=2903831 RepID=UPI002E0DF7A9|nr:hypothetical protein OG206_29740 [Streptomyces sp. NBC_01341]
MSAVRAAHGRLGESLEILGLRVVLLAYWGTVSVLTRRCAKPSAYRGESVRPRS